MHRDGHTILLYTYIIAFILWFLLYGKERVYGINVFLYPVEKKVGEEYPLSLTEKEYSSRDFQNIKCKLESSPIETAIHATACYDESIVRSLSLNLYLVHYLHTQLKFERYFLVVGTSIDKYFDNSDCLLTAEDIVKIKWAFVSNNVQINQENVTQLINSVCQNKHYIPCSNDYFCHSVNDITCVKLNILNEKSKKEIQEGFANTFSFGDPQSYDTVFKETDRFAYGLLKADSFYEAYTDNEIAAFVEKSYYSKKFERIYSSSMGTVFVRTHCPYKNPQEKDKAVMSRTIDDVFNIMECASLFDARQQIVELVNSKGSISTKEIYYRVHRLNDLLSYNTFQLEETRKKIRTLQEGLEIVKMAEYAINLFEQKMQYIKQELSRKQWEDNRRKEKTAVLGLLITGIATYGASFITDSPLVGYCCMAISLILGIIYFALVNKPIPYLSFDIVGNWKVGVRSEKYEDILESFITQTDILLNANELNIISNIKH